MIDVNGMRDDKSLPARVMWYFADPMCSWCWGFAPVIRAIKQDYGNRVPLALILGGLRPYTSEPINAQSRADILHHWQQVNARSGQPFTFDNAMPEGFVYDTEPPCRAVVTVGMLDPEKLFPFFESIQAAFYVHQRDVTHADVLASLAADIDISEDSFIAHFQSDLMQQRTQRHFHRTRQAGVRGFPTIVLQNSDRFELLTAGFRPYTELVPAIDKWIATEPSIPAAD